MYKPDTIIEVKRDDTYGRLSFKCTPKTDIVIQYADEQLARQYIKSLAIEFMSNVLLYTNKMLGIKVESIKWNCARTYKYMGKDVNNMELAVKFKITQLGNEVGYSYSKDLLHLVEKYNNGSLLFKL